MTHVTTWMNLEDIKLTEISHSQKDQYCVSPIYEVPKIDKFGEKQRRVVLPRTGEGRKIGI